MSKYALAKVTVYIVTPNKEQTTNRPLIHVLFHKVDDEINFGHLPNRFFQYLFEPISLAACVQSTPEKTGGVAFRVVAADTGKNVFINSGSQYMALISEPLNAPQLVAMMPRSDYLRELGSMKPAHIEFSPDMVFELDITAWSRKVTGTMLMIIDKLIGHVGSEVRSVIKNPDNRWWTKFEGEEKYTQVWPIVPEITQDYIASAMEHPVKPSIPKPSEKKVMKGAGPKPPKKLTTTEKVPAKTAKKVAKKAAIKRNG